MPESVPQFDLYATLNVTPDAPTAVIVAAHRALIRQAHPDLHDDQGDAEETKRLNIARDWLTDGALRARYDASAAQRPRFVSSGWTRRPLSAPGPVPATWNSSRGRAELEVFVERCGRLTERDLKGLAATYERLGGRAGRLGPTADKLVDRCRNLGRADLVGAAALDAVARARVTSPLVNTEVWPILRWTAFAIAASDVAPAEARFVLTPWRSVAGDQDSARDHRKGWPGRLIALLTGCAIVLLWVAGFAALAALILVGVSLSLLMQVLLRQPRR